MKGLKGMAPFVCGHLIGLLSVRGQFKSKVCDEKLTSFYLESADGDMGKYRVIVTVEELQSGEDKQD